jgi:YD repeat-containing protein
MLLKVDLPDGSAWNFAYAKGTNVDQSSVVDPGDCSGGALTSAVLPTQGTISWDYQMYQMPTAGCDIDPFGASTGIKTRTLADPTNAGVSGAWSYAQTLTAETAAQWNCTAHQFVLSYAPAEQSITTVTDPNLNRTNYYFSVWPVTIGAADQLTRSDGATYREYGLPFSHKYPAVDGKFLSTEVFQYVDASHPAALQRTTYVKYEKDAVDVISNLDSNRSLFQTRTIFNDDGPLNSPNYIDVAYSDNDGLGHYRTTTTTGSFLGTGSARTVTTDYNKNSSLVGSNIFQTGTYDSTGAANTFSEPPTTSPWLANLYSRVLTTEGSSTAVQEVCFDPSTGFLNGTRTYAGGGRAPSDVVAAFGSDANANGVLGAVTSEKYYGGDINLLTADPQATLCSLLPSPGTLGYDIRHAYDHGVRKSSEYFSGGTTVGTKILDLDIDPNTGLPVTSRDTSGVATAFTYDASRRVTSARTSTDPQINYTYSKATSNGNTATGASATISQAAGASGTPQVEFRFDGFGRPVLHSRSLPSTTPGVPRWSRQKTVFDGMGRKVNVSEAEESDTPSHFTVFSNFDVFGRAHTVTKPDGTAATLNYVGSREIDRTEFIHTQAGQPDTAAVTTELYDVHGRLYDVLEPGSNLHASYTYDVGNHLQTASITGDGVTQTRSFNYDNRGFLLSEAHPELGPGGTTYDHYDARGHPHHKLSGAANGTYDLQLAYDPSERLTLVSDQNGARELKRFVFINQNDGTVIPQNYRNGKLAQAVRTNHLPTGDVVVTETYKYDAPTGRLSLRQTDVTSGATTLQSYQQVFGYDAIGEITNPGYPTCATTVPCGTTGAGATFTYQDGSLVSIPGYASSITYLGNMLSQVVHQNQVTDTYSQDATNGLPRPSAIAFSNWNTTCPVPAAPVITAATSVPASSTGNVATVPANGTLQYAWTITGGAITASTPSSITFTAGASGTIVLSVTASFVSTSCGAGPAGTRNVTIQQQQQLSPPINFATTLNGNSTVTLVWSAGASGSTSYRIERKDCFSCSWLPIGPNPTTATVYNDTINSVSGNPPTAHLYHVIAVASGSSDSQPSVPDYAVTAYLMFAEGIGTGTPIRGTHVQELRKAIDALRSLAGLGPYLAGWTDYNPPSGAVLAIHQTDMRTALDQAVFALLAYHLTFTGTVPAHDVTVAASHLSQLRTAVK